MNIEHTLHYESATEAQAAARILCRQGAMIRVHVLPDSKSLKISYDSPLLELIIYVMSKLQYAAVWFWSLKTRQRIAHA